MRLRHDSVTARLLVIAATSVFCVLLPMGCTSPQAVSGHRGVSQKPALLTDDVVQAYVSGVGGRVAEVAGSSTLSFHVLNSAAASACAEPGGRIFITCGLLERMDNESQLAGVLAHEIAHYKYGVGAFTAFGSGVEGQCDEKAVLWMADSGYDSRELVRVMEILRDANAKSDTLGILDNHGTYEHRIGNIRQTILRKQPTEPTDDAVHRTAYQHSVLQRLERSR